MADDTAVLSPAEALSLIESHLDAIGSQEPKLANLGRRRQWLINGATQPLRFSFLLHHCRVSLLLPLDCPLAGFHPAKIVMDGAAPGGGCDLSKLKRARDFNDR
jgi:hypothetical protein